MLIPSIDLMGGKIVQLVQGEKKVLEFDNPEEWLARFASFPLVQLIDLDAAIGGGNNRDLLQRFTSRLPCQVGGGIRSLNDATNILALGAQRIILGSVLVRNNAINIAATKQFADKFGPDCITCAVDSKSGKVAIKGWREVTNILPEEMMRTLEPFCGAFLYTHIDTEGLMKGIPLQIVETLRAVTWRRLMAAGGISSQEEVNHLDTLGIDAVVGMAIYTGRMKVESTTP